MAVITYLRLKRFNEVLELWERRFGKASGHKVGTTGHGIGLIRSRLHRGTCTNTIVDAMIRKMEQELAV